MWIRQACDVQLYAQRLNDLALPNTTPAPCPCIEAPLKQKGGEGQLVHTVVELGDDGIINFYLVSAGLHRSCLGV